jgi:hypothetical protein
MTYNPEEWLESTVREIKNYVMAGFHAAVINDVQQEVGDQMYDVVMEFPGAALDDSPNPLLKTLIHFEIDDARDMAVGIGENAFADNYNSTAHTVNPQYAGMHLINFDVGIWASAESGGLTARLRAKQILYDLLGAPSGQIAFHAYTDGGNGRVEIINYTGGRFITDSINDVPVYRMIDGQLVVRVFSRTKLVPAAAAPSIEEIDQNPNLTILG